MSLEGAELLGLPDLEEAFRLLKHPLGERCRVRDRSRVDRVAVELHGHLSDLVCAQRCQMRVQVAHPASSHGTQVHLSSSWTYWTHLSLSRPGWSNVLSSPPAKYPRTAAIEKMMLPITRVRVLPPSLIMIRPMTPRMMDPIHSPQFISARSCESTTERRSAALR